MQNFFWEIMVVVVFGPSLSKSLVLKCCSGDRTVPSSLPHPLASPVLGTPPLPFRNRLLLRVELRGVAWISP